MSETAILGKSVVKLNPRDRLLERLDKINNNIEKNKTENIKNKFFHSFLDFAYKISLTITDLKELTLEEIMELEIMIHKKQMVKAFFHKILIIGLPVVLFWRWLGCRGGRYDYMRTYSWLYESRRKKLMAYKISQKDICVYFKEEITRY